MMQLTKKWVDYDDDDDDGSAEKCTTESFNLEKNTLK